MPRFLKRSRAVVNLADLHSGHRLGLLNPDTKLLRMGDDGEDEWWTHELGPTQEDLWALYRRHVKEIGKITKGMRLDVLIGGDLGHGDQHVRNCFATTIMNQARCAAAALEPLLSLSNVRKIRMLQGTPAHTAGGTIEIETAKLLRETTGKDIAICWHARLLAGVWFDVAHKGPSRGIRDWTEGNAARLYLRSRMMSDLRNGVDPARVYARHHFHVHTKETFSMRWQGIDYESDIVLVPAQCGMTAYARNVTGSEAFVDNGMVVYIMEGDRLVEIIPLVERTDLRLEEEL